MISTLPLYPSIKLCCLFFEAQPNKKEIIINSTFSFRVEPQHHGAILSCHSIDVDDAHDLHPESDIFSDSSESLFVTGRLFFCFS